jgi:hypothetical protein
MNVNPARLRASTAIVALLLTWPLLAQAPDRSKPPAPGPVPALKLPPIQKRAPGREELRRVIEEEGALFGQRLRSPEAIEALTAFMQRRTPDFSKFA